MEIFIKSDYNPYGRYHKVNDLSIHNNLMSMSVSGLYYMFNGEYQKNIKVQLLQFDNPTPVILRSFTIDFYLLFLEGQYRDDKYLYKLIESSDPDLKIPLYVEVFFDDKLYAILNMNDSSSDTDLYKWISSISFSNQ